MKASFVNPFYQATKDIFHLMMDLDTAKGTLGASTAIKPGGEGNVVITVTGDLSGFILYSFPEKMILQMVKIMSGMEMEKLDSFVTSALEEIANIISGNAVTLLTNNNYNCDIQPPRILDTNDETLTMPTDLALVLPLQTSIGEFVIGIALKEN